MVTGSTSLLLELLGATQQAGEWVAFAGMPALGLLAVHDAGIHLERVAHIPDVGSDGPTVVAALIDGIEHVVVGPACGLLDADRRRLLARARERGTALISTTPWQGASLTIDIQHTAWTARTTAATGYARPATTSSGVARPTAQAAVSPSSGFTTPD